MIAWLVDLAVQAGIAPKWAKTAVFATLAALAILALWGGKCAYDRGVISKYENKQEIKVQKKLEPANQQAADERANDKIRIQHQSEEAHNAIHNGPDSAPSAAAIRHDCLRLRAAGKDTSRIPQCRGS
jgi:hypothetical protein